MIYKTVTGVEFEYDVNNDGIRSFWNDKWKIKWNGTQIQIEGKYVDKHWLNVVYNEDLDEIGLQFFNPYKIPSYVNEVCLLIGTDVKEYFYPTDEK